MAEPFVGEIRVFGFHFAPRGWATCAGQTIPIMQNPTLYSLLGNSYGGDGRQTFMLPDLQGRVAVGAGVGKSLSYRRVGEQIGQEQVILTDQHMPVHAHAITSELTAHLHCSDHAGESNSPVDAVIAVTEQNGFVTQENDREMKVGSVTLEGPIIAQNTGGSLPHDNMQPSLVLNYCIALEGYYPPRS